MEQLVFDLAAPEPPSFANFVAGSNHEVVAALVALAGGARGDVSLLLWGGAGTGKTHLLRATIGAAAARGAQAQFFAAPGALQGADPERLARSALVAVDAIDTATPPAQALLFTLYNALNAGGGRLVVASRSPLAALALREDVRTRLGAGLVYELAPLADDDKPAALAAYARERGFTVPADVIAYLLAHGRRDMATLLRVLSALDRHSLATKRPLTVPLLRDWLRGELPLNEPGTDTGEASGSA
jgi:DnaA family protein